MVIYHNIKGCWNALFQNILGNLPHLIKVVVLKNFLVLFLLIKLSYILSSKTSTLHFKRFAKYKCRCFMEDI